MPVATKSKLPRHEKGSLEAGKLMAWAWPGGYEIVYYTADGGTLCFQCARRENGSEASENPSADKQWRLVAAEVYWEGPALNCDHCNREIESAYGDPEAQEV